MGDILNFGKVTDDNGLCGQAAGGKNGHGLVLIPLGPDTTGDRIPSHNTKNSHGFTFPSGPRRSTAIETRVIRKKTPVIGNDRNQLTIWGHSNYLSSIMRTNSPIPVTMTIAGSDSGGGAGIQADLKTFQALGCFGTTALTAITCQNTRGVFGVQPVHTDIITGQIRAIMDDLPVRAIKTGMLFSEEIIECVSTLLMELRKDHDFFLVIDPVMVAGSGDPLLEPAAEKAMSKFLHAAQLITPNIPEAEKILQCQIADIEGMGKAAWELYMSTGSAVLLKGGHLHPEPDGMIRDIFCEGDNIVELTSQRVEGRNTHGTGCTLSAAITAWLAHGLPLLTAVERAREFVLGAIREAPDLGEGNGPLNHMWRDAGIESI